MLKDISSSGRGGGLVDSALANCSEDLSSNPAGFFSLLCDKMKIYVKEAWVGPLKKKLVVKSSNTS